MPKLKRISGKELVKMLKAQGFVEMRQKGSHLRLMKKMLLEGCYITVPLHDEIDRGTLRSISRSLERCLSEPVIAEIFYTK